MDKILWTLVHFWGVFQFIQAQPLPSPHKQRWTRVSTIFFRVSTLHRVGEGRTARKFRKRVRCFMREIKLCNEKLSLATTPVSGRERSRERAYSRKRVAWDYAPQWGKKCKKRGSPPFLLPRLPLGSLCSPIFSPFSHNTEPGPRLVSEQL